MSRTIFLSERRLDSCVSDESATPGRDSSNDESLPPDKSGRLSSDERNEHRRAGVEESERLVGPTGRLVLYSHVRKATSHARQRPRRVGPNLTSLLDLRGSAHLCTRWARLVVVCTTRESYIRHLPPPRTPRYSNSYFICYEPKSSVRLVVCWRCSSH